MATVILEGVSVSSEHCRELSFALGNCRVLEIWSRQWQKGPGNCRTLGEKWRYDRVCFELQSWILPNFSSAISSMSHHNHFRLIPEYILVISKCDSLRKLSPHSKFQRWDSFYMLSMAKDFPHFFELLIRLLHFIVPHLFWQKTNESQYKELNFEKLKFQKIFKNFQKFSKSFFSKTKSKIENRLGRKVGHPISSRMIGWLPLDVFPNWHLIFYMKFF